MKRGLLLALVVCGIVCLFCMIQVVREWRVARDTGRQPQIGLYVLGAGLSAVATLVLLGGLLQDTKAAELAQAPGYDLVYPGGRLLSEGDVGSIGDVGAYRMRAYGTNELQAAVTAFFDRELSQLGYQIEAPTRDAEGMADQTQLFRQYHRDSFTYRLFLAPLPRRVGGLVYTTGYQHILYVKLSN